MGGYYSCSSGSTLVAGGYIQWADAPALQHLWLCMLQSDQRSQGYRARHWNKVAWQQMRPPKGSGGATSEARNG